MTAGAELVLEAIGFSDPGVKDTHEVTLDWGDGTSSDASVSDGAGTGTATASHAYADAGTYRIVVTILDDDGGSSAREVTVTETEPA